MTAASELRHCELMTFDKQSNARRTAVESKSNRSCNHRITHRSIVTSAPRAGSGVVSIDPLRFLAGCRKRRLNQALSVVSLSL